MNFLQKEKTVLQCMIVLIALYFGLTLYFTISTSPIHDKNISTHQTNELIIENDELKNLIRSQDNLIIALKHQNEILWTNGYIQGQLNLLKSTLIE